VLDHSACFLTEKNGQLVNENTEFRHLP
jgi:hypothetical protein